MTRLILNEINFNKPDVIKKALAAPIQCGFEAEIVWPHDDELDDFFDVSRHEDRINEHTLNTIREYITNEDFAKIEEGYHTYIEGHDDYEDIASDLIVGEIDSVDYAYSPEKQIEYISKEIGMEKAHAVVERKFGLTNLSDEDVADYIMELPGVMDAFKEDLLSNYREELMDLVHSRVVSTLYEKYTMDVWLDEEFGTLAKLLYYFNIDAVFGDDEMLRLMAYVAGKLSVWSKNSKYTEVVHGNTHEHASSPKSGQDYWRVEPDSSIIGSFDDSLTVPAEIISPVFSSINDMLVEMESLFSFLNENNVTTNNTTGLHVTMSFGGEKVEMNRIKLVTLLDDGYLLDKFSRKDNGYAVSQRTILLRTLRAEYGSAIEGLPLSQGSNLADFEKIMNNKYISTDKYRSIHFKEVYNNLDNELIEFRVMGGKNYHSRMVDITQTIIQYATVLLAACDANMYRREYIKKLSTILEKAKEYAGHHPEKTKEAGLGESGLQLFLSSFQGNYPGLRRIYADAEWAYRTKFTRYTDEFVPLFLASLENIYDNNIPLKVKHRKLIADAISEVGFSNNDVLVRIKYLLSKDADPSMPKSVAKRAANIYSMAKQLLAG